MNITSIENLQPADHKYTRKDLFIMTREILAAMMEDEANDKVVNVLDQAITMCNKYVGQLEKPAKPRVNEKAIMFAAACFDIMLGLTAKATDEEDMLFNASEIAAIYNKEHPVDPENIDAKPVSVQKVSAAMRRLIGEGKVEKEEVKGKVYYKVLATGKDGVGKVVDGEPVIIADIADVPVIDDDGDVVVDEVIGKF